MLLERRKVGRKQREREGEGRREWNEGKSKGNAFWAFEKTSRSLHEHLAAFCVNMFYKPYSVLSKICNWKWDL